MCFVRQFVDSLIVEGINQTDMLMIIVWVSLLSVN